MIIFQTYNEYRFFEKLSTPIHFSDRQRSNGLLVAINKNEIPNELRFSIKNFISTKYAAQTPKK